MLGRRQAVEPVAGSPAAPARKPQANEEGDHGPGRNSALPDFILVSRGRSPPSSVFVVARILYVMACLTIPVIWGVVVNVVFRRLERSGRKPPPAPATPSSPPRASAPNPSIEYYI